MAELESKLNCVSFAVKGVNFFGPNSEYVVSGSDDGFIYIWDRYSEGIVQWLCGDISGVVNVLEPHPRFPILATAGIDSNVKVRSSCVSSRLVRVTLIYCCTITF